MFNKKINEGVTDRPYVAIVGRPEPVAHPLNCKNECPYGRGRSFCFPCMAKILADSRTKKETGEIEYEI